MASKLGLHVNFPTEPERLDQFVANTKPAAMLHLNLGDADTPRRWRELSPETLVIGRKYVKDQSLSGPEDRADRHIRSIEDSTCGREGVIDIYMGYNEVGGRLTEEYSRFDVQAAKRCHELGWKYVAGSWSVGCPDFYREDGSGGSWFSTWMRAVLETCDYMGLHEYCAPRMDDPRGLDAGIPGEGWFTLRYRKARRVLEEQGFPLPPFLITECGICSGAAHWDPGGQGGWLSFTNPQDYLAQLRWYDSYLQDDAYVHGAMIYCAGTLDPTWDTYDLKGEMLDVLEGYCISQLEPEVEEDWKAMYEKAESERRYLTRVLERIERLSQRR